jgi:inner membrane transporter RhtA
MILAAVILTPIGVHDGGSELFDPAVALTAFGVAMLASAVPYVLELEALRRLPPKTVGVLLSLEPAAAAAIGAIALSQDLAGRELVAIAMVVIASAGALSSADAPEAAQV